MGTRVCEYDCIIKSAAWVNQDGAGDFHQWGVAPATFGDNQIGLITVGIVEHTNGDIVIVPAESLRFRD